jgi:hypothetical protein
MYNLNNTQTTKTSKSVSKKQSSTKPKKEKIVSNLCCDLTQVANTNQKTQKTKKYNHNYFSNIQKTILD